MGSDPPDRSYLSKYLYLQPFRGYAQGHRYRSLAASSRLTSNRRTNQPLFRSLSHSNRCCFSSLRNRQIHQDHAGDNGKQNDRKQAQLEAHTEPPEQRLRSEGSPLGDRAQIWFYPTQTGFPREKPIVARRESHLYREVASLKSLH